MSERGEATRPRQLTLELSLEPSFREEDFLLAHSNMVALATLRRWPHWPGRRLIITGPPGSGKSHLAAIFAQRAQARVLRAAAIRLADVPALAHAPALAIDDADIAPIDEAALFHLLNLMDERGHFVVMTAKSPPDLWGLRTPDLLSRLRLSPLAPLGPPDEALVRDVLVKLFADHQLVVEPSVVAWLTRHLERSLGAARAAVETLDREALSLGRRVTRPLASRVLALNDAGEE